MMAVIILKKTTSYSGIGAMVDFGLGPAPFPDPSQMDFFMTGDAHVDGDSIRLTDAAQHQRGAIWSKFPNLRNSKEWMAELTFRVGGSTNKDFFGDGFAFWLTKERNVVGHAMGGPDKWEGLGVFFDTYKNDGFKGKKHPYVYAYINNGDKEWEKIKGSDVKNQACHIPFRNTETETEKLAVTVARMTYKDGIFSVVMQPDGADDWVQCFQIKGARLPEKAYFGVTALTGDLVDNHHMLQLSVFSNIEHQPYDHAHENDAGQMPEMWMICAIREQWRESSSSGNPTSKRSSKLMYLVMSISTRTKIPCGAIARIMPTINRKMEKKTSITRILNRMRRVIVITRTTMMRTVTTTTRERIRSRRRSQRKRGGRFVQRILIKTQSLIWQSCWREMGAVRR